MVASGRREYYEYWKEILSGVIWIVCWLLQRRVLYNLAFVVGWVFFFNVRVGEKKYSATAVIINCAVFIQTFYSPYIDYLLFFFFFNVHLLMRLWVTWGDFVAYIYSPDDRYFWKCWNWKYMYIFLIRIWIEMIIAIFHWLSI